MKQQHPPSSSQAQVSGFSPQPSDGLVPKPSDDDVLVRVENVSKKFCRDLKKSLWYGMKDLGSELIGRNRGSDELRPDEFWAVKDVSFELRRGECLGLIGRNGAGKTTLLRMLNGLIKPDKGRIEMCGRVGALIALGAGFNPILTGRENIYVNASVLGLSKKETNEKIDEIIEFSELGEFIDSPVQSYSSGMYVRLGFSTATIFTPDILMIDEIIAVGDFAFRAKCFDKIESIKNKTSVIFVTHNHHDLIRICQQGIILESGKALNKNEISKSLLIYQKLKQTNSRLNDGFLNFNYPFSNIYLKPEKTVYYWGETIVFKISFLINRIVEKGKIRISFMDYKDEVVSEWRSENNHDFLFFVKGKNDFIIKLCKIQLAPGEYYLNTIISESGISEYSVFSFKQIKIEIKGNAIGFSTYLLKSKIEKW